MVGQYDLSLRPSGCPFGHGSTSVESTGAGEALDPAGVGSDPHEVPRSRALEMIQNDAFQRAVDILRPIVFLDPSGKSDALLGDAYFMQERYEQAELAYKQALEKSPENEGWKGKVTQAFENAFAEIPTTFPQREAFEAKFTRKRLLSGPDVDQYNIGALREIIERKGIDWVLHRAKIAVGNTTGAIGGAVLHQLTRLAAGVLGTDNGHHTTWWQDVPGVPAALQDTLKILRLASMREHLFENNVVSSYPDRAKVGFYAKGDDGPPAVALQNRTPDGSWNWLPRGEDGKLVKGSSRAHDPMVGAAFTRFPRNVGDDKGLGAVWPRRDPGTNPVNVLDVSRICLQRKGPMKEAKILNLWAGVWIQGMIHDWTSHGDNRTDSVDNVPIPEKHVLATRHNLKHMKVMKTAQDPTRMPADNGRPPTWINEVTHWWDGSQIYGSDKETIARLRTDRRGEIVADGKIYLENGRLPLDEDPRRPGAKTERTGMNRNWWVGMSMFHTLFSREHNSICDKLRASYPQMSSDEIFLKARMINAAIMAKIHTVEWTPAILPNSALTKGMRANWYGLLTDIFDSRKHKKALSDLNILNRELGGIIGNPRGEFAKYSLSSEFLSVYRMHELLPDDLNFTVKNGFAGKPQEFKIPLTATRQAAAYKIMNRMSPVDLFNSFGKMHPGGFELNNYPNSFVDIAVPGAARQDLGAIDIYRDRERGVPNLNQLRREIGLPPFKTFACVNPNEEVIATLREAYGTNEDGSDNVEAIDLKVGMLAEGIRPPGFAFDETRFTIFILNASFRLLGDRFYTDDYTPETYTQEGLEWIDAADMKSVLLRHYPELEETGLGNVRNAFEPWDEGELDPARHPLREWDSDTKDNPWIGERALRVLRAREAERP